ncbi:ABC transporter permease [Paenibacillus mucilaginosus]|uniref:Inner-membrane translocator n=2 Tax=Paenibacillus mucilaginosus TaxID=61624 RepID=H6NPT9_9BACL|nr:ABC transporter permease [Paenibacillus mucilaginosus]AEI45791.1 inner-membrane translocator [Paenibacillus mucilaginosus KNP414]AFC33445.1 inner-membrane translocator [Paenibacillus mucilaginosus 3016]MCG7215025.1 ABC transporter permease [Paenibacillus mucilaginosus]WDM27166.1 ABC transporter permease [Paenibacillus mucilaginosus]WFA21857.1 ABC transporter permease [Paenibacillus mucilaginosus]
MAKGSRMSADSALLPLAAVVLGLLVGALIMLAGGYDPLTAYAALIDKVVGDPYSIGETIREITPLILTGLSVAFAFRTGLFNIGGEGQFIMGMTGASIVGIKLSLPFWLHAPLAVIAGALLGGLWGGIAGYLKARRGVNEVITTIMLNWIALYLANYIVGSFLLQPGQQRSYLVRESASLSLAALSEMFGHARLHAGIFLAPLAAVVFYILLWKTRQGYELRAVGHSPSAAEYAGMNVNAGIIRAMFIGGVFAGLAGVVEILGVFQYQVIAAGSPGYGFDGVAVALLGGNHPLGVVLAAMLFGTLTYGSAGMSFGADVPPEIIRIIIGSVIFFVASPAIIRGVLRLGKRRGSGEVA